MLTITFENVLFFNMFNVYQNQLSRQAGSRNLTGPKTLPTIWYTYMKLVQVSYRYPILWVAFLDLSYSLLYLRSPKWEGVFCFTSVRPSVQDIFLRIFFSNCKGDNSNHITNQWISFKFSVVPSPTNIFKWNVWKWFIF
jgi:hypothetical protein